MARPLSKLGLLISFAFAGLVLTASPAGAGDRYGPGDQSDPAGLDNGYAPDFYAPSAEREAIDPYATQGRVLRRRGWSDERDFDRGDQAADGDAQRYQRYDQARRFSGGEDYEAIDPYATQDRVIRQQRWSGDGGYTRSRIVHEGGAAWGYADRSYGDPGYAGPGYGRSYIDQGYVGGRGEAFQDERYGRVSRAYSDGDVWRTREAHGWEPVYDARGEGYVDACAIAHARIGERCPFARERRVFREDRAFVQDEQLSEDFFISEGGVGPGIVDFGGGGGGFVQADSFSNASASATASASARVSVRTAVMIHNHGMMMHHYPHPMGHGCGCKK